MTLKTIRCTCRCHKDSGIKHIAACCCPHRIKDRGSCLECQEKLPSVDEIVTMMNKIGLAVKA